VTDFEGRRAIDSRTILAANNLLHPTVLDRLLRTEAPAESGDV